MNNIKPKPSINKEIVIFASGTGTNAENIINYFNTIDNVKVSHVFSNNPNAKVLHKAHFKNVPAGVFDRESFYETNEMLDLLKKIQPDLIILAGFLWLIPSSIIRAFPNQIINIHPALLPKYGGKGMYGDYVHKAVLANKEKNSGITIHYVNEAYDEGQIIKQFEVDLEDVDTLRTLRDKIHILEYDNYPQVIHELLNNNQS